MSATHAERAAGVRPRWRAVAMPSEHGGWGLTLEPVVLGLLVGWSGAGFALGIAAFTAFLLRTPAKLVAVDLRRGRWLDRSRMALRIAIVELLVLGAAVVVVVASGGLVVAGPCGGCRAARGDRVVVRHPQSRPPAGARVVRCVRYHRGRGVDLDRGRPHCRARHRRVARVGCSRGWRDPVRSSSDRASASWPRSGVAERSGAGDRRSWSRPWPWPPMGGAARSGGRRGVGSRAVILGAAAADHRPSSSVCDRWPSGWPWSRSPRVGMLW